MCENDGGQKRGADWCATDNGGGSSQAKHQCGGSTTKATFSYQVLKAWKHSNRNSFFNFYSYHHQERFQSKITPNRMGPKVGAREHRVGNRARTTDLGWRCGAAKDRASGLRHTSGGWYGGCSLQLSLHVVNFGYIGFNQKSKEKTEVESTGF